MSASRVVLPAAAACLLLASSAFAQSPTQPAAVKYHDAKRLGGATSFLARRPLTDAASLRRMVTPGMTNDIRRVLREAGVPELHDSVMTALRGATSTRNVGSCTEAKPANGEVVECSFPVGATMDWMAYRPGVANGNTAPHALKNFRWAGAAPFEAFLFRVTNNGKTYTFVVPKPCGNIGVMPTPPDLAVTKTPDGGTFAAGGPVTFTIAVSNAAPNGAQPANNVRVTDTLPAAGGLAWASATSTRGTCNLSGDGNRSLDCAIGTLQAQESATITVTSAASTAYTACQAQQNPSARATADGTQPAEDSGSVNCVPARLELTKGPKSGTFTIGSAASFSLVVKNSAAAGASSATNVVVTDTLPNNGGLEWATATSTAGTCTLSGNGNSALRCAVGTLAPGQEARITITSRPASYAACQAQNNPGARAVADGNLSATDTGSLNCVRPELDVQKSPDGGTFRQGEQVKFTVVVSNKAAAGASSASNVRLTDLLPTNGGLSWLSATSTKGQCTLSGKNNSSLSCDIGVLAPQESATVTIASTLKTPRTACQAQPNPAVEATGADGLTAKDGGSLSCDRTTWFFGDAFVGKDRRTRPIDGITRNDGLPVAANALAGAAFAQCSPLFGVDLGIAKRLTNNWEVAAKGGAALSLVTAGHKVRQHEGYVDGELNKYLKGGTFLGTGLTMWDITRSASFTPGWLAHFGLPVVKSPTHPAYFVGEGRIPFKHIDDVPNNYQFWGGMRVLF